MTLSAYRARSIGPQGYAALGAAVVLLVIVVGMVGW